MSTRANVPMVLMVGALLLHSASAAAQTEEERAGARSAATEGAKAFEDGRFAAALDLFSRAESIVHAPTHLLYVARSHEKLGHLVKARETYLKITREKLDASAPDAFRDAQAKAQAELSALEPRLGSITIVLKGSGADAASVTMDGVAVPKALVGVPHPIDPGEHKFRASGAGVQSVEQSASVAEGGKQTVELELTAVEGAGAAPASSGTTSPALDSGAAKGSNGLRIGAYAALGVGVVGAVAGTVFALSSKSKRDDANALCNLPGGACPSEKRGEIQSLDDDADQAKTFATIGFVVGGVGIASGVTLFILSNKKSDSHAGVTPWVGPRSAGVFGRF